MRPASWAVALVALALFGGLSCRSSAPAPRAAAGGRPNFLVIYTDDQSYRTLGCYRPDGAWPWVQTPNIDRLASEGVRFASAYGAAWCTPSRASFLTGLLPHGIQGLETPQIVGGGRYDPAVCRFWPAELRKAGYRTAMIGKWHVTPDYGHGRDWDRSVVWDQADIGGDWYNDQYLHIDGRPKRLVRGYSTDVYTEYAVDYVRSAHDKPWFLWLCYNAPHLPNTVHPRHEERYAGAEVPIPPDVWGPREGKPGYMRDYSVWQRGTGADAGVPMQAGFSPKGKRLRPLAEIVREYNRLICAVDEGVGRILRALEETGQLDNTLIVFTSDQGFSWGERGYAWKVGPYEACMRMPMLVRLPGAVARGRVCVEPAAVYDLGPTLLSFAGASLPWEMHGRDLRPLLKDPETRWDRPLLLEHFHRSFGAQTDVGVMPPGGGLGGIPWWISMRLGRYKYIRTLVQNEIEELYDLEADPDEQANLALREEQRARLAELRARFIAELRRTKAGLVDRLPEPKTGP